MNKKIILITLILTILSSICFASTNTYTRTEDDLQIWSDIQVTSYNKSKILNTPKVNENEKIYDFANLFTSQEEQQLYLKATEFISKYNYDMVIVTINNNNKSNAMNYADDFYDYNYFGKGSNYDGILFLIDMDTREMWISTTGNCIRMYNDYRIDKILDVCYSYIKRPNYYKTAESFITKASSFANSGYPNSKNYNSTDLNNYNNKAPFGEILTYSTFGSVIFTAIIIFIAYRKHRTIKKATTAIDYFDRADYKLTTKEDFFLSTHTDRVYDPPSSSSSGGGSSTHFSSSGRSHGGGGRRF